MTLCGNVDTDIYHFHYYHFHYCYRSLYITAVVLSSTHNFVHNHSSPCYLKLTFAVLVMIDLQLPWLIQETYEYELSLLSSTQIVQL